MMNRVEEARYYQENEIGKHFTCPDCLGTYIGQFSEYEPLCPNCQQSNMTRTLKLMNSLYGFLKYA